MLRILSFLLSAPCLIPVVAILIWTLPEWDSRPPPSLTEPAGNTVSLLGLTCLIATLIAFSLAWLTRFFLDDAGPVQTLGCELNNYDFASQSCVLFESRQGLGLKLRQNRRPSDSLLFC